MTENTPFTCPRNEQAVGWALHSLEPDEELAVLQHLPDCPSCRQVADEAEQVLTRLGVAVEQVDPPTGLRDRLMARVADTPQQISIPQQSSGTPTSAPAEDVPTEAPAAEAPTKEAPATDVPPKPAPPTEAPAAPAGRPDRGGSSRPADNRPGRGAGLSRRARRLLAGAMALVAVLAIGGLAVRNSQLEAQRNAEIAQAQALTRLIDQFGRPGVQYALLAREDGATVAAVVVENGQQEVFPIGLPANAVDRNTYVLWGIADANSGPQPLGMFDIAGDDARPLSVAANPGNFAAYAVSLEPGRTMPTAPTEVVAKGAVIA